MVDDHRYRNDKVGKTDEWCETFRFKMTMSMNKMVKIQVQNSIPSRVVTTESTCQEQARDQTDDKKIKIATDERHLQTSVHC